MGENWPRANLVDRLLPCERPTASHAEGLRHYADRTMDSQETATSGAGEQAAAAAGPGAGAQTDGQAAAAAASRGVFGRGAIYALGTAGPILANTLVTPALTRVFATEPAQMGLVVQALVVLQVTMMVASLGMPSVITRTGLATAAGPAGARALLLRGSALGLGVALLGAATAPLWGAALDPDVRSAAVVALLAGGCFVAVEDAQAMLRVLDRPFAFVQVSVLATLGGPVLGLVLLLVRERTATVYLVGVLLGYALAGLVGLGLCLRGAERSLEPGAFAAALRMGLPILPHLVALYCTSYGLLFVASGLAGRAAAALLSPALLLGAAPGVVTSSLNNSWAPTVYAADPAHRAAVLERTTVDIGSLTATVAGGVAVLAPWLLQLFAPATYRPVHFTASAAIAAFGTVLAIGYLANAHLVFLSGRTLGLALVTPLSLGIGVLGAALLGSLDLRLVAAGYPLAYLAQLVGVALLRRRVSEIRWHERVLARPFAIGAVGCALGALLPPSGVLQWTRLLVAVALGLLALHVLRRVLGR